MNETNQQLQDKIAQLEKQKAIIREQEKFLRSIYDNVREAIFVVDVGADGNFYYQGFNPAAIKLTGIGDVVGKTPQEILPSAVASAVVDRYRRCVEQKSGISYEECLPFQGKDTWWLTILSPLENEDGKVYRLIGTSLNISGRKRIETELDKEKNFLKTLLDNLSDGIVACDEQGILTLFNRATREFHGLPQEPIPAAEWAEHYSLYFADGKTLMKAEDVPLFRALQGESIRDMEIMIVPKNGESRSVLVNCDPIINRQEKKIGAIAAMRDTSALKLAQKALQESQAKFCQTFIHAAVGMAIVGLDGSWLEVNPSLCKMLDYSQQELLATNFQAITYGKDLDRDLVQLENLLSGQISAYKTEKRYFKKSGELIWINLSVSLVRDASSQPLYFVALIENINERKQAVEELTSLKNELEDRVKQRTNQLEQVNTLLLATTTTLEKRNEELDQFAYVTSHDLKAPLRAIANLSEWIEEDLEDKLDGDTKYNMKLLRGRVLRLESLINGLLDYSRVGRLNTELQLVNVAELLAEIVDLIELPQSYEINIQDDMPTLMTLSIPLQQIFSNLITNAIKHGDRDKLQVNVSVRELDNYYEFTVSDNGKGIEPKYHDRIFTIFQTLEARDTKESTGIGLAIVKKIVENQGGEIVVESDCGQGCKFKFTWKKQPLL